MSNIATEMPDDEQPGKKEEGFGLRALTTTGETAAMAVQAHTKAAVEARYIMALNRPRDLDEVRTRLLRECKRPGFAEVARYKKPIGKGVYGLSIRFAEAAIQAMRNIYVETPAIYDSIKERILRVAVTDLESNITYSKDVTITKTVERKKLQRGQVPISSRPNSWGDTVYLVDATDDDILNKEGALVSKAMRTLGLRLLPGWLKEECENLIICTQRDQAAEDPDAHRRQIADAFADMGVHPGQLAQYLGHDLDSCTPAEIADLRALYAAIKDGEATWAQAMESKGQTEPAPPSATDKLAEAVHEKLAKKTPPAATENVEIPPAETGGDPLDLRTREGAQRRADDLAIELYPEGIPLDVMADYCQAGEISTAVMGNMNTKELGRLVKLLEEEKAMR